MEVAKRPSRASGPPVSAVRSRLLHMDPDQATFVWGPLAVVMWRGECTPAAVRRVETAGMEVLRRHRPAVLMGIVEPSGRPPSNELRRASAECNDRLAAQGVVGIAGVLTTTGFAASVVRGVITGLTLLSKSSCPFKVFESPPEAVTWLARVLRQHGGELDADACARALGEYRAQYERYWTARLSSRPPPSSPR